MCAVIKLVLLGLATFAFAFAIRRVFFWDVMPVSWTEDSSATGALVAAYLLLSLENLGVGVAAIALSNRIGCTCSAAGGEAATLSPVRPRTRSLTLNKGRCRLDRSSR